MKRLALVFVCAAAFGCEEKRAPPPPPPTPPAAETPKPAVTAAPAGDGSTAAADPAKALGAALAAASEGAKGDTPCEQAYNAMDAMVKAMEKNMPPGGKSTKQVPTKEKYMAACKELPEGMQKCMAMSYAMAHQAECQEAQKKLDPALMAKVKAMMGK